MRVRIAAASMAAAALLGLAACGGQTPTPTAAAAPVTVTATATKTAAPVTTTTTKTAPTTVWVEVTVTETPDEPETITVEGVMDLTGADNWTKTGSTCAGDGGYDDFNEGTTVTIKTGAGEVLALGSLDAGTVSVSEPTTCRFTFTEDDVPFREGLIMVEASHRGDIQAHDVGDGTYVAMGTIGD